MGKKQKATRVIVADSAVVSTDVVLVGWTLSLNHSAERLR